MLPQLARPNALLKLMGEARIEQTKRQNDQTLPVSPEHADHLKRKEQARNRTRSAARKHARAVARSQRRGNFGLAKAIMQHGGHTPAGLPVAPGAQHADQGSSTQPVVLP